MFSHVAVPSAAEVSILPEAGFPPRILTCPLRSSCCVGASCPIAILPFFNTVTAFEADEGPEPFPITKRGSVFTHEFVVPLTILYRPVTNESNACAVVP